MEQLKTINIHIVRVCINFILSVILKNEIEPLVFWVGLKMPYKVMEIILEHNFNKDRSSQLTFFEE